MNFINLLVAMFHFLKITNFSQVLKQDCLCVLEGLCSILPAAVDVSQASYLYLIEDGLDLWLALIECTPDPLPKILLDLARFLPEILCETSSLNDTGNFNDFPGFYLACQTENLLVVCEITKAYSLTDSTDFAEVYYVMKHYQKQYRYFSKFPRFGYQSFVKVQFWPLEDWNTKVKGRYYEYLYKYSKLRMFMFQNVYLKVVEFALQCYKSSGPVYCSFCVSYCLDSVMNDKQVQIFKKWCFKIRI